MNFTDVLKGRVNLLSKEARACFAAACATRLVPGYKIIWELDHIGEPSQLENSMEFVWNAVLEGHFDQIRLEEQLEKVMQLVKLGEKKRVQDQFKEDAAAAVAYALRSLSSGNIEDPVSAAVRAIESTYSYCKVTTKSKLRGPALVAEMFEQPALKLENARQMRDLDDLTNGLSEGMASNIKSRAELERALPNDAISIGPPL